MLKSFRESLKTKPYLKWALWLTAFSMTLYLGYYFIDMGPGTGPGAEDWAARVNGEVIPGSRFLNEARNRDARYRQLLGEQYETFKSQIRLGQEVVGELISREIQRQEAAKLGLRATPEEIFEEIRQIPTFQDPQGNFVGRERYQQLVERGFAGLGPDSRRDPLTAFEQLVAEDVITRKWRNLVTEPAMVTEAEIEELYRRRHEKTSIDYVLVRTQDQEVDTSVAEDELRRWYDRHPEMYERAEGRKIAVALVERQKLLDESQVTDADVKAYYEANRPAFSHPEQRRARHILLELDEGAPEAEAEARRKEAERLLQRLQAGEDFAALAREFSQDPTTAPEGGDLGFFRRGAMVPAFDQAAFSTPVGGLAPVVRTEFGFHVIQVTDERAAGESPLEEVRSDIRRRLALQRAALRVDEVAARVAAQADGPEGLRRAAEAEGLAMQALTVRPGDTLNELGAFPGFVQAVFALEVGAVSQPLGVGRGKAVVAVEETVAKSVAPFSEVQARVRADLLNERLREIARRRAKEALPEGATLAAAAKRLGQEVKSARDLAPGDHIPGTGGSSAALRQALFGPEAKPGVRSVVDVPGGSMIYEITGREPFDPTGLAQAAPGLRAELLQERRQSLLQSILTGLIESYRIELNEPLIERVSG